MKNLLGLFVFLLVVFSVSCSSESGKKSPGDTDTLSNLDSIALSVADSIVADTIPPKPLSYIVVDKTKLKLFVFEETDTLFEAKICVGRVKGNKKKKDDRRTPEGDFKITDIQDASAWLYHTDDDRWIPNVYGPWFLRLDANGWQGIGIHGTSSPSQIGSRRSKGCIRLKNEDIVKLHELVFVGMDVKILPDT